ncbi:MAG TPA: ROK family protein [Candidatus Avamphibacillus sp.]|nr:ROK family protein [Candidatus Avamphibacillus sp.]
MKRSRTGDQNLIKKINKTIVLKAIEEKAPISRAQISKETGLNKATVSTMVSELINDSLVSEMGAGQSSGGRKPVMLYFNNQAGYSIGIDLGVNYILAILTDLSGNIIFEINHPLNTTCISEIEKKLISLIDTLIQKTPKSPYRMIGIGIGVPGIVDNEGKILFAPNLKWRQIELKNKLEQIFFLPVIIENEANAGAYGEQLYGSKKDVHNLIYVSFGIGIGTGIIIDGKLFTGATGISGEMGHITIKINGEKCPCGNHGCWELYASESSLLSKATKLSVFKNFKDLNIDHIIEEAQNNNNEVLQLLNDIGEYIGFGLINIINTFNPELVIIGNRFKVLKKWLINPINRVLDERLHPYHRTGTKIDFSNLGLYSCAVGASSMSILKFLSNNKVTVR